ncbi:hypothetical protein AWB81_07629 [Caballeronia arationis]|nr:hypothetical protein AWB81_07629 [Caballeronia arationis]
MGPSTCLSRQRHPPPCGTKDGDLGLDEPRYLIHRWGRNLSRIHILPRRSSVAVFFRNAGAPWVGCASLWATGSCLYS